MMAELTAKQDRRIEELEAENNRLRVTLLDSGFRPCDIPACNCGGWHLCEGYLAKAVKDAYIDGAWEFSGHSRNRRRDDPPVTILRAWDESLARKRLGPRGMHIHE